MAIEWVKPWYNSDQLVQIEWVRTNSPPIGVPTCFGARIWEDQENIVPLQPDQTGVNRYPSTWSAGQNPWLLQKPDGYCADPDKLLNGFDINEDLPLQDDIDGINPCCGEEFAKGSFVRNSPKTSKVKSLRVWSDPTKSPIVNLVRGLKKQTVYNQRGFSRVFFGPPKSFGFYIHGSQSKYNAGAYSAAYSQDFDAILPQTT
jgi:hypothetical protein